MNILYGVFKLATGALALYGAYKLGELVYPKVKENKIVVKIVDATSKAKDAVIEEASEAKEEAVETIKETVKDAVSEAVNGGNEPKTRLVGIGAKMKNRAAKFFEKHTKKLTDTVVEKAVNEIANRNPSIMVSLGGANEQISG